MKQYKFLFTDLDGTLINTISGKTPRGSLSQKGGITWLQCIFL